jgi:structural maintenance of chromosome 4
VAVHGRLGDLGCIPKQFDVAVSTACGLLDHIVTDTAEDAQACMEFLRERRLGRCV